MFPMTPWVQRLLIANVAMYFVTMASSQLMSLLAFYPPWALLRPWTLITYMFLHAGISHLLFNMIGLFFFGPRLEDRLGSRGFLWLYFLSGIGGAVFSLVFARDAAVAGASGAVYGILLGFALYWPRERIYIWGVLPVEAWLLATLLVFGSLYAGINPTGASRTAHFAHLGGLAFAFAYLKMLELRTGAAKRTTKRGIVGDRTDVARWEGISIDSLHEMNREEVRVLLAKAEADGVASLSPSEREFLERMAAR